MNKFIRDILRRKILADGQDKSGKKLSGQEINKRIEILSIGLKRETKDALFILAGIFSAGFGLRGFLLPNNFIDGGAMGISLLIHEMTKIPISFLIVGVNLPFIILGSKVVNRSFAFKTALAIVALAALVAVFPFPQITSDKLLISIFGGFFLGAGIGMAIRGSAVIDGTEVLAIFLSKKMGVTIGDIILVFNIIIFSFAAYLLSLETAMYAQKKGTGKRGVKQEERDIIYTVITRLEIGKLMSEIEKIDTDAFIITQSVKNIKGGMVKKRPLDHD